jgi:DNA repair protein RadD
MELRWYQSEACEAVWNCFRNNQGNPLIELPTGSGKSICVAELCRAAVEDHAGQVIVLAHRKELLEQNYSKIVSLLPPNVKAGLFSAGLRRYSQEEPIIVAGIQSCYEKATWFGRRHLVIIDEAHLCPNDGNGMYQTFLTDLQRYNDRLRIVGLTATPFRTGEGAL